MNTDDFTSAFNDALDSAEQEALGVTDEKETVADEVSNEQENATNADEKETADSETTANADDTDSEENADEKETADSEHIENADNTVILAKDGKHTIPYEKLLEARNAEKAIKAELATVKAELDALRQGKKSNQATDETEQVDDDLDNDEEVFMSQKDLNKFLNDTVAKQVNERLKIIEQQQAISVAERHYQEIFAKHPDADSIVESSELANWIAAKPNYVQNAIHQVLKQGTSAEVISLLDDFKKDAKTVPEKRSLDLTKINQAAEKKISQAQKPVAPDTLSNLDGAKTVSKGQVDYSNLSGSDMLNVFSDKSLDEIEKML